MPKKKSGRALPSRATRAQGEAPRHRGQKGEDFTLEAQTPPESADKPRAARPRAAASAAAGRGDHPEVLSYRHSDKRKNNPEVGMVKPENDPDDHDERWCYDPHIDPALQFDFGRAQVEKLIDDALASGDDATMRAALTELKRYSAPYLNWTGKAERTTFEVETVSLHVHERIDPASILSAVRNDRRVRPAHQKASNGAQGAPYMHQPDLFAAPFENLPLRDAIDFYKHERGWANRLIAGDSLLVMNSLLQKESLAGQVQMIYIDPPYGIKYGSNFQPFVNKRDVKDRRDEDLTQEPEMIKAFRDTWELGIHSYLTYLRDRLLLAKELLHESGSVFVQISDENLHLVRGLLDEIFGAGNFVALITFRKTSITFATQRLGGVSDYVIWYAKDMNKYKYHTLYKEKQVGGEGATNYGFIEFPNGSYRRIGKDEGHLLAQDNRLFSSENLMSGGATPSCMFDFVYQEKAYSPVRGKSWKTNLEGMRRLSITSRLVPIGDQRLYFKTYFDEYAITKLTNLWADTRGEMEEPAPQI